MFTIDTMMGALLEANTVRIRVYEVNSGETVFEGFYDDISFDMECLEIDSFDLFNDNGETGICFNVSMDD